MASYLEQITKVKEQLNQQRQEANKIREEAKAAGTWGVQQNADMAYTPPKVKVPEEQKTSADKMWDRNSQPQKIETTTRAKQKRDTTKKAYDTYVKSDEYKKRLEENDKKAKTEAVAQMFLNPGQPMPQPKVIQDEKEMQLRAAMEQAEKEYNDAEDQKVIEQDLEAITGLSAEERRKLEQYAVGRDVDFYQNLNAAQLGAPVNKAEQDAQELFDKYGYDRINEMANTMSRVNSEKMTQEAAALGQKHGDERGFLSSVGSVGASIAGGLGGTIDYFKEMGRNDTRFKTLDPNVIGNLGSVYAGAVRQQVGQNIAGDVYDENGNLIQEGGALRGAAALGYQGVMSAADSVARAAIGGGAGGAMLAATGTFAQTMSEASKQGATPAQAALLATTTAGIEALSEKIPLDNLIRTAKGQNVGSVIANALRQAGIEATTEEISLLGTVLAEAAILQEKSTYQRDIMTAIMSGIPVDDAIQQASQNIIDEAVNTALVSMISGGASSLGGSGMAKIRANELDTTPNMQSAEGMKADTMRKLAEMGAEQTAQPQFNAEQDRATAPELIRVAMENQQKDDQWSDTVAPFRPADIDAIKADSAAMKWLSDRGFTGDLADSLGKVQTGKYQLQTVQTKASQQPTTQQQETKPEEQSTAQTAEQPEQAPQQERNLSDTMADVFRGMQENNGKASNRMAETVMSDPAAMQELGIASEGTKAEQRRRVKEEMEKLFQNQNKTTEVSTPAVDAQAEVQPVAEQSTTSEQSVETVKPTEGAGTPAQNFTGKAEYQNLLSEDNVQRDRPGDVRPMNVPKTDSFGERVSELVGNAYGAEITTDKMANAIEELVQDGALGFDRRSNQDSMNRAAEDIQKRGVAATRNQITNAVNRGKIRDGDIEKAILLYTMYNSKDTPSAIDNASEILVDLATMANITGRNLQMFRMLRQLTPAGQVATIKKTVERNVNKMVQSGAVKKGYEASIDPELMKEYQKAAGENMRAVSEEQKKKSAEKMQLIMDTIYQMEASKMPATMKAKWDAWRYMAMLGNAKTQVRNVAGNALFVPYKVVKDRAAALGEKLFLVPKDKRTKSMFTDLELLKWAREDRNTQSVKDALQYSAKLGDNLDDQKFRDNAKVFDTKALEAARKFIESVPQAGDMLFKNGYYARTLADFMKARGYKAADIQNGKVSAEVMNEARSYAIQEAMKATFNDSNVLSDFLSTDLRYKGENPAGKLYNTVLEGVLPFRKTPANIMVRFEEYSPLGIANTIWKGVDAIRGGKSTAADVIDSLASSLTGSAAMALGYFMAKGLMGIKLTGSNTGEDEERQGHQDYALEWADKDGQEYSYRIDWAAPANLPLFVGANIYNAIESAGEDTDVSKFTSFVRGMGNAFEPMLALSCLSGVNDLFESARYAEEGEALYTVASNIATGYFTQGIPALLRQASQASNEYKQTTFANSNDPTMRDLQTTAANIPFVGDKFKTDKVNEWGEKESQGTAFERIVNSFLNPGTLKKIDTSAVEQEISRLNNAQDENVSPDYIPKVVSYTDREGNFHKNYRLTEEQYQKFGQTQGQTARAILDTMIKSTNYQALTDEQKAAAMNMVYSYAKEKAMGETLGTTYGETWMMKLTKGKEAEQIISRTADNAISNAFSKLDTAWDSGYSKENTAAYSRELSEVYDSYSKMNPQQKQAIKASATGNAAKYIEAREKGISHDKFVNVAMNVNNIKGTGAVNKDTGKATVRDIDKRQAIAKTTGLSDREVDIIMKAYMPDYDKNDESPETTEFKYQYAREELGLSPKEYATTYRAYLDNGKKAQKIAAIRAMGYDYRTANALYKLYYGRMKDDLIEMYG